MEIADSPLPRSRRPSHRWKRKRSSQSACGVPTWEIYTIYTIFRSRIHCPAVSNASHLSKRPKKTESQFTSFFQDEEVIDMECGVDDPNIRHPLANKSGQDNMKTIHQFFSISVAKTSNDSTGGQRCNANGAMCSSTNSRPLDINLEQQSETTYHQDMTLPFQDSLANWAMDALNHVDDLLCDFNIFCGIPTCGNEAHPCKGKDHVSGVRELNSWESLPDDIQGLVLKKLKYEDIFQAKLVSRGMKNFIESPAFLSSREGPCTEGLLACLHFYVKDGPLEWSGFDLVLKEWRPLPTLKCLPPPDVDLFKDYLVSASSGLLCANVSKSLQNEEELVVCNPMTQTSRILPPLNFRRNPVLMHLLTDPKKNSYKVIAVGSCGMMTTDSGQDVNLSRKTEVFDSLTSQWAVTGDMPGLEFGLNEYQTGVCINGILYCIAFLEDGSGKGVVAYDVAAGDWLSDWKCPLPTPGNANSQLVECDGEVYLFSEHETGRTAEHRIDKLENTAGGSICKWNNLVREKKTGGRGLLVYPQHVCVGFGVGKLCIFDTIEHTGKVHDIRNGGHFELPPSPVMSSCKRGDELFHSLNPLSFTFAPDFQTSVLGI